jgi:hypothetical protein
MDGTTGASDSTSRTVPPEAAARKEVVESHLSPHAVK